MRLHANGLDLEVEAFGSPDGEPLVLVMGLGMQLVAWPAGFVRQLVARGFRVIRFDNRDIGLSQGFDAAGMPNLVVAAMRHALGLRVRSAYSLDDMATDTLGLLDALGIGRAHVCGASMGGMIAQRLAARAPERVKSLTLLMTTSGARHLPKATLPVQRALLARPRRPEDPESVIEHHVRLYRLIGSPAYSAGEDEIRALLRDSIARAYRPAATARQLVAIAADGDRTPLLRTLAVPTHVIHGLADPLVPAASGRHLASIIPDATLDLIEGMGHDLPMPLWPRFVAGIADAAARQAPV
jgi:pimeloyl-ACP methyl ester carboxylesterase